MDPPAFEDRHAVLDPQRWAVGRDLRQQEPRPAPVARVDGEQLGQGCFPPPDFWGRGTARSAVEGSFCGIQNPSVAAAPRHLPCKGRGGDFRPRGDSSAGDQRQASCHTTHNADVLLLFLSRDSGARVNGATRPAQALPEKSALRSRPAAPRAWIRRTPCACSASPPPCRARARARGQRAAR